MFRRPLSQKSLRSFAKTVQNRYEAKDTRIYIPQENAKRGVYVKGLPEDRAILLARYMIENNATVRACASKFGVSKSTVHKDITTRLAGIHKPLAAEVKKVLETNKAERHIRGGLATKEKYELSARYYKKKQKKAP
jgi:putative DeoR family transcriptional regulator (stage III sporulation protein D)